MDILFLFLAFLAAFHLIYEGVIAPELRMGVRNDLFEVRDVLRDIKCREMDAVDDESFDIVHDAVNRFTHRVSSFTVFVVAQMKKLRESDPQAYERVRKRSQKLAAVPSRDFQDVLRTMDRVLVRAMLINSGAWFVFIIPIVVVAVVLTRLSKIAMATIALPGNLFDGIAAKQGRHLTA